MAISRLQKLPAPVKKYLFNFSIPPQAGLNHSIPHQAGLKEKLK